MAGKSEGVVVLDDEKLADIERAASLIPVRDMQISELQKSLSSATAAASSSHKKAKDQMVELRTEIFDLKSSLETASTDAVRLPGMIEKLKEIELSNANYSLSIEKHIEEVKTVRSEIKKLTNARDHAEGSLVMRTEEVNKAPGANMSRWRPWKLSTLRV